MQAMILTAPPHLLQTETSILKIRLSLSAHVKDLRLSADDFSLVEEEICPQSVRVQPVVRRWEPMRLHCA